MFDKRMALLALDVVNRRVAALYKKLPRPVTFMFVPLIDRRVQLVKGEEIATREVLGDCDRVSGTIRLVMRRGWERTAIHELIHLYNPTMREPTVRKRVPEVVRYLKSPMLWGDP